MALKKFPAGTYGRQTLHFYPAPYRAPLRAFAALVFPWQGEDEVLLCNIEDRGWCIPSGRVEAFETSLDAVKREAMEEAGAELACIQYIGCYSIREKEELRWADVYVARVTELKEISMPEESLGRKIVKMEELPEIYHLWTDLTKAVFEHSQAIMRRSLKY
jgi:8-oxo-dGTP diphosphatase